MTFMELSFIARNAPQKFDDIPQPEACKLLRDFVINFKKQKKKAALIYGPPGTGKSTAAHLLAKELNYEIIEVNASDFRNSEQLQMRVGAALKQQSLFSVGKIILIDEVDGISGTKDRGGVPTLTTLIAEATFPVIMTANDPWDTKFSTLRNKSNLIEFPALDASALFTILKTVCQRENILYDETSLKTLSRRVGGDLRAALNDLFVLAFDKQLLPERLTQDISRNKVETILTAVTKILKSTDITVAAGAFESVDEELEHCLLWLHENVPKEYTNPPDLVRAYELMSKADIFLSRIRRRQHWRFLVYVDTLLTAGIATAKDNRGKATVKYGQPMRLLKLWQANQKYAGRNSIIEKLALETHTSRKNTLRHVLPFVKYVFQKNQVFSSEFKRLLTLEEEEIAWLEQKT